MPSILKNPFVKMIGLGICVQLLNAIEMLVELNTRMAAIRSVPKALPSAVPRNSGRTPPLGAEIGANFNALFNTAGVLTAIPYAFATIARYPPVVLVWQFTVNVFVVAPTIFVPSFRH